jgi:hypothetical protein
MKGNKAQVPRGLLCRRTPGELVSLEVLQHSPFIPTQSQRQCMFLSLIASTFSSFLNTLLAYIAISACNFRSSSSSSSSSTLLVLPSACGTLGSRPTLSPTGTLPVFSICSSSCSCCSSASSSSSSSSSTPWAPTPCVIASLISSPIACCSRRSSLELNVHQ